MRIVPAMPDTDFAPLAMSLVGTEARPLHFSDLKRLSESAKDFAYFLAHPPRRTGPQAIGALVHEGVLGPRSGAEILVFPGDSRRGKVWESFARENPGREIATLSELDDARPIVEAINADTLSAPWLVGKTEVPLKCELVPGVWIETRGLDVLGDGFVTELKTTHTPKPERFIYDIRQYQYFAQLALYRMMAAKLGLLPGDSKCVIVVAGTSPPWHVYPKAMPESWLQVGAATVMSWLERFQAYRDAGEWPGFVQAMGEWPDAFGGDEDRTKEENGS